MQVLLFERKMDGVVGDVRGCKDCRSVGSGKSCGIREIIGRRLMTNFCIFKCLVVL